MFIDNSDYESKIKDFENLYKTSQNPTQPSNFIKSSDIEENAKNKQNKPTKTNSKTSDFDSDKPEQKLELSLLNIEPILEYIYTRAKNFTLLLESYKDQYNKTTTLTSYYEYVMKNYKNLNRHQLEKFIKSINFFELNDYRFLDLYRKLNSFDGSMSKSFDSASLIIYSIAKTKLNLQAKKETKEENKKHTEALNQLLIDNYSIIKNQEVSKISNKLNLT